MSRASEVFAQSILDADNLLAHFNKLNTNPPPPENEILKRASLIMAMTAWEAFQWTGGSSVPWWVATEYQKTVVL